MAGASRDTILRFVYETTGDKDLANTANLLVKMADDGKLADAEAIELAATLKSLAAQSKAVGDALSAKAGIAETMAQLKAAKGGAAALNAEFDRTDTTNRKVTAAFAASDKAVADLTAKLTQQQLTLAKSEGLLQKAGIDTTNLAAANAKLQASSSAAAASISKVAAGASAVEASNKRVGESYDGVAGKIERLKALAEGIVVFLGLEKIGEGLKSIVEEGEKFDDLQKQFATAFGGLEEGAQTLEKVRDFAKTVPQPFEDIATAAIKLKRAGFDPLDGTLQALVDNNNALNGSQENLLATIDALGKANVKGAVNIKSLVSLTEQGIPVFDLLGTALGVSADRVRELANSGQLGQNSIKLLIEQLGKLRAGAAASELGDTDSQLTKLKDTAREFLETIASSGVLQVFRDNLKELNDEVDGAAKSGKLKQLAQSISDGIVATAGAIKTTVGFVVDYSGALLELGKTYLVIKGINIAGSLLESATALGVTARESIVAAAEAGTTAGAFGKLSAAAKAIPAKIGIVVAAAGVEFTLTQLANLIAARGDEVKAERDLKEAESDRNETLSKLAERIATVKTQYQQYADVALKSGDELKSQSADQLTAYEAQLDGAKKFYQALVVQARLANDAAGLQDAKAKLAGVTSEIAAVNAQLALTKELGGAAANGLTAGAAALVAKLSEVKDDAKALGDFVQKAFEGFDLSKDIVQVGDFALAIDAVAAKGGKAATTIDTTLLESLKKLSGQDLLKFQSSAIAAIDSVGASGEKTSETLKATLEAALDRLGVKAEDTGQKITKAGADEIAAFQAVAENAQASAKTITAAFDAAVLGTKTVDEAKALGAALKAAADTGRISLKDLADTTLVLDERIRTLTAAVSPLQSQFDLLGIKSQAQFAAVRDNAKEAFDAIVNGARDGTAAQEDVRRAFVAYANAAHDAGAASSESAKAQIDDQLELLATINGIPDAFVRAGDEGKKAGDKTSEAFGEAKDKIDEAKGSADEFGDAAKSAQDKAAAAANQSGAAFGAVIALNNDQVAAMKALNEQLSRGVTYQTLDLTTAKNVLEQIGPLIGAGAQVLQQRLDDLNAAAEHAQEVAKQMAEQADSIQDQIDQLTGNDQDIEDRRHENALKNIQEEAQENGTLNTAEYNRLVSLENQLHQLKLQNIQKEKKANADASGGGSSESGGPPGSSSVPGRGDQSNTNSQPAPTPAPNNASAPRGAPSVTVNVQGSVIGADPAKLGEQLARLVRPQLDRLNANRF